MPLKGQQIYFGRVRKVTMPKKEKIIFLDIDGVLITKKTFPRFDRDMMSNLKRIAEATGAKFVLSSDRRRKPDLHEKVVEALEEYDMDHLLFDSTPTLPQVKGGQRPTEIMMWMDDYEDADKMGAWIAIDDRNLLGEKDGDFLEGHFVRINKKVGLSDEDVDSCIQLLQEQEEEESPKHRRGKLLRSASNTSTISTADTLQGDLEEEVAASPVYQTCFGFSFF